MPGNSVPGATGTLALVPANGGTPRALAGEFASARYGVWSPDGKKILLSASVAETRKRRSIGT